MDSSANVLNETTDTGLSVRGNCWRAKAIALAQMESAAFWVADAERRAARRARRGR